MNNIFLDSNKVFLSGKVLTVPQYSHSIYGEGFYETHIEVKRLSEQKDILPVTISERLIQDKKIQVGSVISVEGQFRSYNKIVEGKSKLMLTVFVRDIIENDISQNPNNIELKGYICKAPVYRMTPFKREICDLLLAVNRAYNKSDYIPCIAWGRNARFVQSIKIGEKLIVNGRIQSREYQKRISDEQFDTRIAYEVSISKISTDTAVSESESYQSGDESTEINYDTI